MVVRPAPKDPEAFELLIHRRDIKPPFAERVLQGGTRGIRQLGVEVDVLGRTGSR